MTTPTFKFLFWKLKKKNNISKSIYPSFSRIENATDTDLTETTETESTASSSALLAVMMASPEVASLVRKELAVSLRDLIHHGLLGSSQGM